MVVIIHWFACAHVALAGGVQNAADDSWLVRTGLNAKAQNDTLLAYALATNHAALIMSTGGGVVSSARAEELLANTFSLLVGWLLHS